MNRLDESESTPKKRNLRQDETVAREAITKSGRKVKRPAHLDSPERTPSASPSEARKSIAVRAKMAVEPSAGTPNKRAASKELISPKETKSSRKTNASARKTVSEHMDTPKTNKENKQVASSVDDAAGISKSGRKIKIPTKLMEFESDVLSSPRKLPASNQDEAPKEKLAKTPGRSKTPAKVAVKNIAAEQCIHPGDEGEKHLAARKTPGRRAKSVAPDQLDVESVRTPKRRAVSTLFTKEMDKEGSASEQTHPKTPGKRAGKTVLALDVKASPKTSGRRAKSVAPGKEITNEADPAQDASETEPKASKNTTQTPGRRVGKSMVQPAVQTSRTEGSDSMQAVPKTSSRRAAKSMIDANETTLAAESPRAQRKASTKTPGRRQKSVAVDKIDSIEEDTSEGKSDQRKSEDNDNLDSGAAIASTVGAIAEAAAEEPLSRSGRKLKPKKVFDYEQEEKSTEPNHTAEQVSTDSKRKRKVDNADESMKSPTKKKIIENVAPQMSKLKNRPESNLSLIGAESPHMENPTDVSVSRSGRKIKPKKMFGFEDGVETSTTFVHVTGSSSPTLNEETVEAGNGDGDLSTKNEITTASTPSKRTTTTALAANVEQKSAAPMAVDQKMEGFVEGGEIDKQQSFITKRGVDDHHHNATKATKKQQHFIDEIDRAMVSSEPPIIRTSIGFGKPKVQRQTLSEVVAKSDGDTPVVDPQAVASSRSGRKIKPKKFFDTNDLTTANRQSSINPKANQPVPVPIALSPKQQIAEKQQIEDCPITESVDNVAADEVMHSAEGIDIPEGPCKLVNEATDENVSEDSVEQKQQEPEKATSTETDHNDVVMEPEEAVQDMKVQEKKVEVNEERSIATQEELVAQLVEINEERSITAQEELAAQLVEEQSDAPEEQQTTQDEGKGNQLLTDTHIPNVTNSDGSVAIGQQHHGISAVDTKSEEEKPKVVSTGSVISSTEMMDEASFGSIEYLDDEMNNVVEHIKKPPPLHEQTEEVSSVAASAIPSIVIVPETPAGNVLNETYSPVAQNSSIIDITTDTPRPVVAAAAPRTPDSKLTAQEANDECSPDKPPEVIEIMDSPAVAAFCKQINDDSAHGGDGGSATSTPLAVKRSVVPAAVAECVDQQEQLAVQLECRKRSLSASAADTTMKRNVTFHSPANSTMLVETIDERLMLKGLQDQQQQRQEVQETSSKSIGEKLRKPRKRSLSEHKPSELKRNKCSKLPNFKSIHANYFNRMESVADFMKRKESRSKQILSSCSPATKLLSSRPVADASGKAGAVPSVEKKIPSSTTKPFIFKSAAGGIPVPSAGLFVTRTNKGPTAAKKPIASDTERMANRMKQFQATFKPKLIGTDTGAAPVAGLLPSTSTNNVAGERPVEQLRTKQSKILKGVRTNRRFELQMKHRDNLQHQ